MLFGVAGEFVECEREPGERGVLEDQRLDAVDELDQPAVVPINGIIVHGERFAPLKLESGIGTSIHDGDCVGVEARIILSKFLS